MNSAPNPTRARVRARRADKRAFSLARQIVLDIDSSGAEIGDRLPSEHEMLARYGVARATLREALRFLELQGTLALKPGPGGGPVIREPCPIDFASTMALQLQFLGATFGSLMEVRRAVGPMMAAQAAQHATDHNIVELETSLAKLRKTPGGRTYAEENRRFHDHLAWASCNPVTGLLISALHIMTNASEIALAYTDQERAFQVKCYARLLKAIKNRDALAAHDEMSKFLSHSVKYLEQRYPDIMSQAIRWWDVHEPGEASSRVTA